jgi:hypothetical protein
MATTFVAGAATVDITPLDSQFLFGYPHVPRMSTGVHDPLSSCALFLGDGKTSLLFIANDVIYVCRDSARRARERIERETGVSSENIMITATHTHSGPMTVDILNNGADPAVPKTDPRYVERLENGIVEAAVRAFRQARPAEIGLAVADGSCVGTNRHDPAGPSIPRVPVLLVRDRESKAFAAAMVVCAMHPTVLHEDSTLLSGDFPAMTRRYLQDNLLGKDCPVVYHTGPCGNQSPRHVTKSNTFEEAERLGNLLGRSIAEAARTIEYSDDIELFAARAEVNLPRRKIPSLEEAKRHYEAATARLDHLRNSNADGREIRTAECDWFGAEETLALAQASEGGRQEAAIASVMPAEIMLLRVGPWSFVGWPGETFVEFALMVTKSCPSCYVISMANGELQGYLVTEEAVQKKWYEAMTSMFLSPDAGMIFVRKTLELLGAA